MFIPQWILGLIGGFILCFATLGFFGHRANKKAKGTNR